MFIKINFNLLSDRRIRIPYVDTITLSDCHFEVLPSIVTFRFPNHVSRACTFPDNEKSWSLYGKSLETEEKRKEKEKVCPLIFWQHFFRRRQRRTCRQTSHHITSQIDTTTTEQNTTWHSYRQPATKPKTERQKKMKKTDWEWAFTLHACWCENWDRRRLGLNLMWGWRASADMTL